MSFLTPTDSCLFKQGRHFRLYDKLGAHLTSQGGVKGAYFSVWAPHAKRVDVVGDFNQKNKKIYRLHRRNDGSGLWGNFIEGVKKGDRYHYRIGSHKGKDRMEKIDPFGFFYETSHETSAIVWDLKYRWQDDDWMRNRYKKNSLNKPISIYEVHLGSWQKKMEEECQHFLSYRAIAETLVDYVKDMGFTHVELLPVMEHPFYGSWGYQTLGFFAPTSRYGTPQDFMYLIDRFHQKDIGVILDWVPAHFPSDAHGLEKFDGTHLYETQDMHPDWESCIFNNGRHEVMAFLISNALFWLDKYHVDGLRVDAVASMLYLDFSRQEGQWKPNFLGGKENLDSVAFLRCLNEEVEKSFSDVLIAAEESSAWPHVSQSPKKGGLGFDMKWNMGWMNDTLSYFHKDQKLRSKHQEDLTFCLHYAFDEKFLLPLSHDEVVHGKSSLLGKMPGPEGEKFSNLRCLYGYMYAHPGKKLLFMGSEMAPWSEWNHDEALPWDLLQYDRHQGVQNWIRHLNRFYKKEKALYQQDFLVDGFEWVYVDNKKPGVISFLRKTKAGKRQEAIFVVCHFKSRAKYHYRLGVPQGGAWKVLLNSDDQKFGGRGLLRADSYKAQKISSQGCPYSITLTLPPLSILFFKR